MNRKTEKQLAANTSLTPLEVELLRRVGDLERKYEALKNRKVDVTWAITTAIALAALVVGGTNYNSNERIDDMQTSINGRFDSQDKRLGSIESLLMEGRSQPAVYYPAVPQPTPSQGVAL